MNPNAPKEDVAAAQAAADKAQAYYASFADKKREAQGRIEQYRASESTGSEDPQVRAYADQFFKGDYEAAQKAIEAQRAKKSGVGRIR